MLRHLRGANEVAPQVDWKAVQQVGECNEDFFLAASALTFGSMRLVVGACGHSFTNLHHFSRFLEFSL